jgi:hypothetical protein
MERNILEIKSLIKEAFRINGLAGRITSNIDSDGNSLFVWNKGLVSEPIARIIPSIDRLILKDRTYKKQGQRFAELYRLKYLQDDGYMNIIYDSNLASGLFRGGVRI